MDPGVDHREDEADLGHLVVRIARQLRQRRMRSLEPFGLAAHQARAFFAVARADDHDGELRLSDLAARLRIAPRSATDVVDALQAMELIERQPCPNDRRATRLALTDHGRSLRRQLDEARVDRSDEFFAMLSAAEQATLRTLLAKVASVTEADSPDSSEPNPAKDQTVQSPAATAAADKRQR